MQWILQDMYPYQLNIHLIFDKQNHFIVYLTATEFH